MNPGMRAAFQAGSGVDPLLLKTTLVLIAVGVILLVSVWVVVQLIDAYRNDDLTTGDVVHGVIRTLILVSLAFFIIVT